MNSIEAYQNDMKLQLSFLKSFKPQKMIQSQKNILFTGSGDSLVSTMLAESFSDGMIKAIDPLELFYNKALAKSKHIYFVSISGNTITNIRVAKIAKKSTAITMQPKSKLAKVSDDMILLSAPNSGVFTAGSISFLESALTCISLVSKFKMPQYEKLFSRAKSDAKRNKVTQRIFILGNQFTYPIAMYCAAKFYEILGYDAHYCKIEQFSHMELFSAKSGDTVIIFEKKNPHSNQLAKSLKKIGLNVIHNDLPSEKLAQIMYCIFFSQFISLYEAKNKKKTQCHFVTAKKIRSVSNDMIY